jgi:hypothetical protein
MSDSSDDEEEDELEEERQQRQPKKRISRSLRGMCINSQVNISSLLQSEADSVKNCRSFTSHFIHHLVSQLELYSQSARLKKA